MSNLNSFVLVKCNENVKKQVMKKARDDGTTISQIVRDFLDCVSSGEIKPLVKFQLENGLEPGTYAVVPIKWRQEQ